MRIVMVGPFGLRVKSTVRERALPLASALAQRGHSVAVVAPPWDSPEDAGQRSTEAGVTVINTRLPRLPGPLYVTRLTRWLLETALEQRPDVMHFFKPKAYAGFAHLAADMLRRLRHRAWRLMVDEDDWEQAWNAVNPYSALEKACFRWQEPWGLRHADAVTVASLELTSLVKRVRGGGDGVYYVPNGVREFPASEDAPTAEQIRAAHGLNDHPTILVYTRFVEFRVETLTAIIGEVTRRAPSAHWLIVGTGFFGEEKALAKALEREGVGDRARFAGWTRTSDLPGMFGAADVALHLYEDTVINRTKCSVKLLDLLAAGVPVVASAVGQNKAYIQDGQTGHLVSPDDASAHAETLMRLLGDDEERRRLGEAAAADVRSRFSWDRLALTVERAYLGLPETTVGEQVPCDTRR